MIQPETVIISIGGGLCGSSIGLALAYGHFNWPVFILGLVLGIAGMWWAVERARRDG